MMDVGGWLALFMFCAVLCKEPSFCLLRFESDYLRLVERSFSKREEWETNSYGNGIQIFKPVS